MAQFGDGTFLQRDDMAKPFDNNEGLKKNAPDSEGEYFKVPKVIS